MPTFADDSVQQFLAEKEVVVLATVDPSGWPLAMPMWFVHDTEYLGMVSADALRKVENLAADPRVCVVAEGGVPGDIKGVVLRGEVEFLEGAQRDALAEQFHQRYSPHVDRLWGGTAMPSNRRAFRVRPRVLSSWGLG